MKRWTMFGECPECKHVSGFTRSEWFSVRRPKCERCGCPALKEVERERAVEMVKLKKMGIIE